MLKNEAAFISVRTQVKDISQQNHITWKPMEPMELMELMEPMDQTEPTELMKPMSSPVVSTHT